MRQGYQGIFLLIASFMLVLPVQAHNIVSGAYVDGMTVEGEIGFSNGEMASPGVEITITDSNGHSLGKTQTEADGLFSFVASQPVEHIFKANLGAGHVAEIIVAADDFSNTNTSATTPGTTTTTDRQQTPGSTSTTSTVSATDIERIVRKAVAQQVKPLQKELRAYKEKVMFRDITGGLGFIFGMFGIAAWLASRKTKPAPSTVRGSSTAS